MITRIVFDDGGTDHKVHSAFRNRKFDSGEFAISSGRSREAHSKLSPSKSSLLRNVFPAGFAPPSDIRAPLPLKFQAPAVATHSRNTSSRDFLSVVVKSSRSPTGLHVTNSSPQLEGNPHLLDLRDSPPSTRRSESYNDDGVDDYRYVAGPFFRLPEEGASGQVKTAVVKIDAKDAITEEMAAEPSGVFPRLVPMPPLRGTRGGNNSVLPAHGQSRSSSPKSAPTSGALSPSSHAGARTLSSPLDLSHHAHASRPLPQRSLVGVRLSPQDREGAEDKLLREIICGQERALELNLEVILHERFVGGHGSFDVNTPSMRFTAPYNTSFAQVQELGAKAIQEDPLSKVMQGNFKVELKFFNETSRTWVAVPDDIHWIRAKSTALDHENNKLRLLCRAVHDNSVRRTSRAVQSSPFTEEVEGFDAFLAGIPCGGLGLSDSIASDGPPLPGPIPHIGLSDDDVSLSSAYSMNSRTMQHFQKSYNDSWSSPGDRIYMGVPCSQPRGARGRAGGPSAEKLGAWADNLQRRINRTSSKP